MPLDGLSASNVGIHRLITPMETTLLVEQAAKNLAEETIKKTEKSAKSKDSLQEDNEDAERDLQGRDTRDIYENSKEDSATPQKKGKNFKKYKVKFNSSNDMVELIDKQTGEIIETITPDDLIGLISSSINPAGILVDRKA